MRAQYDDVSSLSGAVKLGRGWLLLEHLKRWRTWNDSSGSPFYRKVDMGNIALMGHSRGGEAVAAGELCACLQIECLSAHVG